MDVMDRRAHQALKVERALALESSLERFDKAAQLKKRLDEIGSVNVVGDLVKVSCRACCICHYMCSSQTPAKQVLKASN